MGQSDWGALLISVRGDAGNKGADADPHASRYCDGDKNVATLAGKRPHLSVNGKAEP